MKRLIVLLFALALVVAASAGEWHIETVDSANVGTHTSLALDSSEYPHISYYDDTNDDLKYARWDGSSWQIETVDSEGWVGPYTSLALDSSDRPHISYYDMSNYALKYARWNGSSWQIETVDSEGYVGRYNSLALDSSDRPHISYCDTTNYDLKYARWNGSSWQIETVDSEGYVGWYTSLALDSSDRPHISYYDMTNYALKYARWNGSSWQIETVDSEGDVGEYSSLALDSSDYPHISYYYASYGKINDLRFSPQGDCEAHVLFTPDRFSRGYLKYARWNGSSWQIRTVDSAYPDVGMWTSLALDSSDRPHISYYHLYWDEYEQRCGALKYARWNGSSWQIRTVDSAGEVGEFTSLALDSIGNPHISYYDDTNDDLKYAYWEGGPGLEVVELTTDTRDEGVLVGWSITGDVPVSLRVLRSEGDDEPETVSGTLPGSAEHWLDMNVDADIEYRYWLEVTDADGWRNRFGPTEPVTYPGPARELTLYAHPNPASDSVTFEYTLPENGPVTISLYDLSGRLVASSISLSTAPGRHEIAYDTSSLLSGVYVARLITNTASTTQRLVIAR